MSDVELRDLLHSGARNLKVARQRRLWVVLGAGAVTLTASVVAAEQDGIRGFAIALVVGAIVGYGLWEFLGRRMREPLERRGIDVERILVE